MLVITKGLKGRLATVNVAEEFLQGCADRAYGDTKLNDFARALVQSLADWSGERTSLIKLEGHGREEMSEQIDLSRTVGWFTSLYPVLLQLDEGAALDGVLKAVKEQLRAIPDKGMGLWTAALSL
ncbi:hypothetical protein KDW_43410 [Dictyobacter vulcani]|uniref:Condensation domain-containing protein n=1 Tax=Dictyobacter vulcani TaxID=2607529 RepID=A0A5J4KVN8_9CHLR|nr:condensation domain-containing protein [Dictyobacter vulcani]GER90179.1 hypothetical protein KDW_43410 [Dictyobacter vulcani]